MPTKLKPKSLHPHLRSLGARLLPVPVERQRNGNTISRFASIDPCTAFFINSNFLQGTTRDRNRNLVTSNPGDDFSLKYSV